MRQHERVGDRQHGQHARNPRYFSRDALGWRERFGLVDQGHDASAADFRHIPESANHGDSPVALPENLAVHPGEASLHRITVERAGLAVWSGILWRREKESLVIRQKSLAGHAQSVAVQKDLVGNLHVSPNREDCFAVFRRDLNDVIWLALWIEFETGDLGGIERLDFCE